MLQASPTTSEDRQRIGTFATHSWCSGSLRFTVSSTAAGVCSLQVELTDDSLHLAELQSAAACEPVERRGFPAVASAAMQLNLAAVRQIAEYLRGERTGFQLPLFPSGTKFQLAVWRALLTIPFGQIRTYAKVAKQIGRPRAWRAVGTACAANPLPILIPCHRVIASNGGLGGYALGMPLKRWLLRLEGATGF